MSYSVKTLSNFDREVKKISKKHKLIKYDISDLIDELEINPTLGVHLGQNIYKLRLAISGSNKGKSGGARIITYVLIDHQTVYLADIYLKSEYDTIDAEKIIQRLREAGVI
ncbi:type II toxin-antitoxin system RelE/ParE family toxin [Pedobacter mendelii]|uniref:Addiction module toxin RelE n=1 Tax=Pedobacter mendelii TaxID=1908240 RepID=A0ABQ2BEG7_9SPHI|nr:type II toxin-antitoxin system RelE/ParE family toxin [Pedobacter mendelii]GGI22151.1 hypothetical protein GCM10008119_01210 [Pedobacter mendelii]